MKILSLVLVACLTLSSNDQDLHGGDLTLDATANLAAEPDGTTNGWVAKKEDCICGISDLRKVSNPAKVDYDTLLDATPQLKEIKRKRIDPESREGRALTSKAKTLVARTCEEVQRTKSHCGVWKDISNKDARTITDITADVSAEF